MGCISKKRAKPRINKRNSRRDKKVKVKDENKPTEALIWNADRTAKQNFASMGLVQNVKPSMRQTNEGKILLSKARVRLNKAFYAKQGMNVDYDAELAELESKVEQAAEAEADHLTVFPELQSASKAAMKPTKSKLKSDEKEIVKKLIKKYGLESHGKMRTDIKINYLQWSKGQIAKNIELYRISTGEIKAEYKD